MKRGIEGKVAVVTGASRGLGRNVALGLARQGARVALVARSAQGLREAEDAITREGGTALALPADVTSLDAVDKLKRTVVERLGRVDILVNAAGVFGPIQFIQDSDPRLWVETLMVNTVAPYLTCRAFASGMAQKHWGRIINFSSAASLHPPFPLNSAYATSKVALNQFTRTLAMELQGTGVTANVIHPGEVKTEMWADIRDQSAKLGPEGQGYRDWAEWVGRTGGDDPQKAVDLVLRLAGDEAASITGQFLWIEGGLQSPISSWESPKASLPWREK